VLGGAGTILVVILWAWMFPELRRADSLTRSRPQTRESSA
jgi:hypothetical protein